MSKQYTHAKLNWLSACKKLKEILIAYRPALKTYKLNHATLNLYEKWKFKKDSYF